MKTAIITGANDGIGYFLAKQLLEDGFNVAVIDLTVTNLTDLEILYPNNLYALECDVCDMKKVKEMVSQVLMRFKSIDYAIHNACIAVFKNIEDCDDQDFKSVFDVNFIGATHLIKAVIPVMKSQNKGKVFLTSSGVGVMGFSGLSPYACSKGAIETLAKCMNLEYNNSNISFHILHPPLTNTKSASKLPVPKEFMADPGIVGIGLAKNINKNKYIISHSFMQSLQNRLMYIMPLSLGRLMNKLTIKAKKKLNS